MQFIPRTTPPSTTDLKWISVNKGGLNKCIQVESDGSVLPNCTGYAWGRIYELLNKAPSLSTANASSWYGYTQDGYLRGQNPMLGAVICFKEKGGGPGHVAVVEKIDGTTITTSNSAYGGQRFYMQTLKLPYDHGNYEFQGFIYPDTIEPPYPPRKYKKNKFPWVLYARMLRNRQLYK